MIRKFKKKGFTIVELVIVIAVIGILAAVLIPVFISLNGKAEKAADSSLVQNLNTALRIEEASEGKNKTIHDAVLDVDEYGYKIASLVSKSGEKLLWDQDKDEFFIDAGNEEYNNLKYWEIRSDMPEAGNKRSIYAGNNWSVTKVGGEDGIDYGFDAGYNTNIVEINYKHSGSTQDVTIRTNSVSTTLNIDAANDNIHHYDALGALNIIKANTSSYHEYGQVNYAEISYGRIVLERGAEVEEIHVNKKTDSSFDTVIIANNGGEEALPERITRDAVTVSEETLVVKVETNGSSENVYVYADGDTGKTNKVTEGEHKQNENVNSALGQLVLDNGANPGEKAQTAEEKAAAKDEIASEAVSAEFEEEEGQEDYVARIGQTGYMSLLAAVEAAVDGNNIALLKDVPFTSNDVVIVNKTITLNLGGHAITGSHDPLFVIGASVGKYNPTAAQLTHTGHLTIKGEGSITSSNWDMFCVFQDAALDIYGGTFTGFKATFYVFGTLNIHGGEFTATSPNNTYVVQVKTGGVANVYGGSFTTPVNGGYGVYLDKASSCNFGALGEEGPTFNTWRSCIASNGSETVGFFANIYSGTFHSYRDDNSPDECAVIQMANATTAAQTLNIYGGEFEQTGTHADRSIFNVRYGGEININIYGGKFVSPNANRLFNSVGNNSSGWPSTENVHVTVSNGALPHGTQSVKAYNSSSGAHTTERDFEIAL